jgi:hydrocephalus-inducing protein
MTKLMKVKEEGAEEETEVMDTHNGSLFFPLPNGTALLYRLLGTATEPDPDGSITETVTAKKAKSVIVPVKNWSRQPQRFRASWEVDGEADPSLFIRGANAFDVAGNSTKDFKLNFLALKTGNYSFTVTFKA